MDIRRGSFDGVTRSTSSRQRLGGRVSLQGSVSSPVPRENFNPTGSFEILPPESGDLMQDDHLALEEYLSSSEEESEGVLNSDYEKLKSANLSSPFRASSQQSMPYNLELLSDDNYKTSQDDDATGDEENQAPSDSQTTQEQTQEDDDLRDVTDPVLKKAIKKMRKLDKILANKIAREKAVKRQRLIMHRQYEDELERIKKGLDRDETRDERDNTSKFLALVPPPAHSEGLDTDDDIRMIITPLFQTQVPEGGDTTDKKQNTSNISPRSDITNATKDTESSSFSKSSNKKKSRGNRQQQRDSSEKDEDVDFIQRNIQLACDAGSLIAMTDDEKKRLEDLLKDVEMLADESTIQEQTGLELQIAPGIGFHPSQDESSLLADIDNKLKALIPFQEFEQICSTPSMHSVSQAGSYLSREAYELGEKILQEGKDARDQQDRLRRIEEELVDLQTQVENEISNPSMSKTELDDLFRQCDDVDSRAHSVMSSPRTPKPSQDSHLNQLSPRSNQNRLLSSDMACTEYSPRSENSHLTSRVSEKLSEENLQKLLEDAKERLGMVGEQNAEDSFEISNEEQSTLSSSLGLFQPPSLSSTGTPRATLVSNDVIQKLLKNPRATLIEAQAPSETTDDPHKLETDNNMEESV